jgi:putative hydrolase of the HAD superfamily
MAIKYSTVFFDWSGVIADDSGDEFIEHLFRKVGATDGQTREIIKTYFVDFLSDRLSEIEFWDKLKIKYNLNITELTSKEFNKWRGLIVNRNIIEFANELKVNGLQVAVLTNIIKPVYNIIQLAGYYDLFDDVIASCEVGLVKPQKEIYTLALQRLGTTAQQSIFIDDNQFNVKTANEMGFKTILAHNPNQIIYDLKKLI